MGEFVYPIARNMYKTEAPKLTGMIVDALLNVKGSRATSEINEILSSVAFIMELVIYF